MAIYNPKRARELEAAARLAESQRQRELARGQREQRTTEQILGLVEGLIGAAPQAAQAFEQSQAERVLAGERPLEMEEAKDPFTSLGRFLFEPGIQRKVQQMAPERLAKGREVMKPLTTQEVSKGLAGKYEEELGVPLPPQMGAERAARDVMEKVPAAKFVPEAQREALAVGDVQRVQAEQAAAAAAAEERTSKLALEGAKAKKELAQAGSYAAKLEAEGKQLDPRATLLEGSVDPIFEQYKDKLNVAGDPALVNQAKQELRQAVMQEAQRLGMNTETVEGLAAIEKIYAKKIQEKGLKAYTGKDYDKVRLALNLYEDVKEVDRLRKETQFKASDMDILKEELDALDAPLGLDSIEKVARGIEKRAKFTEKGQYLYVRKALELKNTLMKAANDGYNVTNMDAARLSPIVLNPFMRDEEWSASVQDMLRGTAKDAKEVYAELSGVLQAPAVLREKVLGLEVPEKVDVSKLAGMKPMQVGASDILAQAAEDVAVGSGMFVANVMSRMVDAAPDKVSQTLEALGIPISAEQVQQIRSKAQLAPAAPAAPQTSQQQMRAIDETEESAFAKLKSQGKLKPGQAMFIITNSQGKVSYVTADDSQQGIDLLERVVRKKDPNASIQKYTGNLAGGQ